MSRQFSLAGLLRVRGIQERAAAERLSRAHLDNAQTQARERQVRAALSAAPDDVTDVRTLAALAASRVATRSTLADLRALDELQRRAVEEATHAHTAARRDERGLARLAEAHERREFSRQLLAEQTELDEVALRPRTEETP